MPQESMPRDISFRSESSEIEFHPDRGEADQRGAIRRKASEIGEQAVSQVTSRLDAQKTRAASTLGGVAQALLTAGQQLRGEEAGASPYIERLAGQVERLSGFLQSTDVEEVVDDVGQFARRHPGLFVGGAFALGFLGARFLKSSTPQPARLSSGYDEGGVATSRGYVGNPIDTTSMRPSADGGSATRAGDLGTPSAGYGMSDPLSGTQDLSAARRYDAGASDAGSYGGSTSDRIGGASREEGR